MNLKIIEAPTIEPLSLSEAKLHIRKATDDEDPQITELIKVARQAGETITKRALASAIFELTLNKFPANEVIILPMPPIELPITSINYKDKDGTEAILSSEDYIVYDDMPAKIIPAYGKNFPDIELYPIGAVKIRYKAGYKTTGENASLIIPEDIKQALKLIIGHFYENREEVLVGSTATRIPLSAESLLYPYRIFNL